MCLCVCLFYLSEIGHDDEDNVTQRCEFLSKFHSYFCVCVCVRERERERVCFQTEPSVPVYRFNLLSSLTVNTGVSPYLQVKLCAAMPVKVTKLNVKG